MNVKSKDIVWYFTRIPGSVMQRQDKAEVLAVSTKRVKIYTKDGKEIWVSPKNLRLTV